MIDQSPQTKLFVYDSAFYIFNGMQNTYHNIHCALSSHSRLSGDHNFVQISFCSSCINF